jgi:hypothetical protein
MEISNLLKSRAEKEEKVVFLIENADPNKIVALIASVELDGNDKVTKALGLLLRESLSS